MLLCVLAWWMTKSRQLNESFLSFGMFFEKKKKNVLLINTVLPFPIYTILIRLASFNFKVFSRGQISALWGLEAEPPILHHRTLVLHQHGLHPQPVIGGKESSGKSIWPTPYCDAIGNLSLGHHPFPLSHSNPRKLFKRLTDCNWMQK